MRCPKPLLPLWNAWMAFSHAIGMVMSSIILSILWILVFGAYAVCLKIIGLVVRAPVKQSYWHDVSEDHDDFAHQF
jgi:hypothetical protein